MAAGAVDLAPLVVRWQRRHGRHGLPWQGSRDAYRVWLSEVMLQQTQVTTVMAYYGRFVQRFPDVQALAAAPLDDVLALWSGLGYYSRARNLHRCAQAVVAECGGSFPTRSAQLAQLPGIGRSTAAAIAAFCFGERAAILDGNVKRVLARWLAFEGDLGQAVHLRALWAQAEALLPQRHVDIYTQGLMDLGATVCKARRPACDACPLRAGCLAHRLGQPEGYPQKTRRAQRGERENALLWLQRGNRHWLVQRPLKGVWAGLWSLPEYAGRAALQKASAEWPGSGHWLPIIEHALTHFDWSLHPLHWTLPASGKGLPKVGRSLPDLGAGRWLSTPQALELGLPAPVRRLLQGVGAQAQGLP